MKAREALRHAGIVMRAQDKGEIEAGQESAVDGMTQIAAVTGTSIELMPGTIQALREGVVIGIEIETATEINMEQETETAGEIDNML